MRSLELFAGGGGLTLATHAAGFTTEAVFERDRHACATLTSNRDLGHPLLADVQVHQGDVRDVDWSSWRGEWDLLTAGPPCQPFSAGGRGQAADDPRDMFPVTCEVIRQLQPKAFLIENVRGLTRASFSDYLAYIKKRLMYPQFPALMDESWDQHSQRLSALGEHNSNHLHYALTTALVNAADYGVPQQRWRYFIVGFRSDLGVTWDFPPPTHSGRALAADMATGNYWQRHHIRAAERMPITSKSGAAGLRPWKTVRDALVGLPQLTRDGKLCGRNHRFQPGARSYPGHTGSYIDAPAKALKAGVHGVPGGENMIRFYDGSIRYFSVREAARMQTFPDTYELAGPWGEAMRQLGNAVPVLLAERILLSIRAELALQDATQTWNESQALAVAS